jgi:NAD kinase
MEERIPWTEQPRSFTCNQFFWGRGQSPRTIFVSRKETPQSLDCLYDIARWVKEEHPTARILIEESNVGELNALEDLPIFVFPTSERNQLSRIVDFIVCLGGDGSLLHVSSTFGRGRIPPVVAFSLGTLSFLASFKAQEYASALAAVFRGGFLYTNRMRLVCRVRKTSKETIPPFYESHFVPVEATALLPAGFECAFPVINEVTLHRGTEGQTIKIDCSINDHFVTKASGDGLIVGTATGSTAYALSCGGSMVHPAIKVSTNAP